MPIRLNPAWESFLGAVTQTPWYQHLIATAEAEYRNHTVYPPAEQIFAAFADCSPEAVSVVILGQDPYHNEDQADGRAFSVSGQVALPPSLKNILTEIADDLGTPSTALSGDLHSWTEQGVLLLNTTLTVRAHTPLSHRPLGWEQFTDIVITELSKKRRGLVFMLWGAHAKSKQSLIDSSQHLILTAPHPSPLSAYRGFFGCKHFSQANTYLREHSRTPIVW